MRIAYKNLIDDLAASSMTCLTTISGYPLSNIQDQRLSTKYITDTTTTQSVMFTFPVLSEYPDSSAATIYINHFNSTVDSFVASGGVVTASTTIGLLTLTATTAATSIVRAGLSSAVSGQTIIAKICSPTLLSTTFTVLRGASVVSTISGVTSVMAIYSSLIVGGGTASTLTILGTNTASTGTVLSMDFLYIGSGAYTSTLLDSSGNDLNGIIAGAFPIDTSMGRGMSFDGSNDYVSASLNTMSGKEGFTLSFWAKEIGTTGTRTIFLVGVGQAVNGIFIYSTTGSNIYTVRWNRAGGAEDISSAFTLSSTLTHICVRYIYSTKQYTVFTNGVITKQGTLTNQIVMPTTNMYMGAYLAGPYYFNGIVGETFVANRALSDKEIKLYYDIGIVNMDGIVNMYKMDNQYKVNTSALLGHTIKSNTLVKIEGHNNNNWGSPDISEIFSYISSSTMALRFLAGNYVRNYWKYTITGQASIEIGRVFLGDYIALDPSSILDFRVIKKRDDNIIHGRGRQKYASIGERWRRFELSFPDTAYAMINKIEDMYDEVGNHTSVIFCNFDSLRDYQLVDPCYVSIDGELSLQHSRSMRFTYSIALEEEL